MNHVAADLARHARRVLHCIDTLVIEGRGRATRAELRKKLTLLAQAQDPATPPSQRMLFEVRKVIDVGWQYVHAAGFEVDACPRRAFSERELAALITLVKATEQAVKRAETWRGIA